MVVMKWTTLDKMIKDLEAIYLEAIDYYEKRGTYPTGITSVCVVVPALDIIIHCSIYDSFDIFVEDEYQLNMTFAVILDRLTKKPLCAKMGLNILYDILYYCRRIEHPVIQDIQDVENLFCSYFVDGYEY